MLEKIGLPARPSLRGNTWVVDASHCQGCSSQFTFINRKHHCRRCGGIFCNSCTQQRMVLRGQGDSPVRICEPCKKLEEAARFELRHGYKSRTGRGSLKPATKDEDDLLNAILGADRKESSSTGVASNNHMSASAQRATSSASTSNVQAAVSHEGVGEMRRSQSVDQLMQNGMASPSPEELRQQALEEKRKYKILKGEGKSEEALRAFKRGKELERQAGSLEIYIRKNRKKNLASGITYEIQNKDASKESGRKNKATYPVDRDKDDLVSELRELGWSGMDLHDDDRKSASMTLEGELSSLLGEIPKKVNGPGSDKTEVLAIKKKALMLKREGKLAEAKEELKRAKILEKQLEEQELLAGAEDSDDELSAIIHSMDNDKQDDILIHLEHTQDLDFDRLAGTAEDLGMDGDFEVTDKDMEDPEIVAALKSLGWEEDSSYTGDVMAHSAPLTREALLSEIFSLKREAVTQKRAGNIVEAMSHLKKAKLLEKDLENFNPQPEDLAVNQNGPTQIADIKDMNMKPAPKSKMMIQKELLGLKKKSLALRREGRLDKAEEELRKGKILERQLEEMENTSNIKAGHVNIGSKGKDLIHKDPNVSETLPTEGTDVTDQDMNDPTYLSILRNLGWNDNDDELQKHSTQKDFEQIKDSSLTHAPPKPVKVSRRTKAEIQRELLGLKRKALSLRRQGNTDEAEEVLETAKALEAEMAEMEAPKKEVEWPNGKAAGPSFKVAMEEADEVNVTENDMTNPALLSTPMNLGWKDELEPVRTQDGYPSKSQHSSGISVSPPRSKGKIQRELLDLKREAHALRRNGQAEDAEELLQRAKLLEDEMQELEAPKSAIVLGSSKDSESGNFELFTDHERQQNLNNEVILKKRPLVVVGSNETVVESSMGLQGMENDTDNSSSRNSDLLFPPTTTPLVDNQPSPVKQDPQGAIGLLGGERKVERTSGDDLTSSPILKKLEERGDYVSNFPSHARSSVQLASHEDFITKDEDTTGSRVVKDQKSYAFEASSGQEFTSQSSPESLRQAVLSHKKKAVALKRDGKLAEACEELRQAKLLEKSLAEDGTPPKSGANVVTTSASSVRSDAKEHGASGLASKPPSSASNFHSDAAKEQNASSLAPKPLSGRDRFKLQQESLSHKRQAMKLRREGRMQEAEAEFELAKSLEAQLEESAAHDSTKSSSSGTEAVDDVVVEDLLDPQLMSALKAIGLDDPSVVAGGPKKPELTKSSAAKTENVEQERIQLEERIKAEKVKAVQLKRSGKQAEALDALRRAKMLEKKLNSLSS